MAKHSNGQEWKRRLPSGATVDPDRTGATWQALVVPGPSPQGVASTKAGHPSHRFHVAGDRPNPVVAPWHSVPGPVPGAPSRRERRPALVAAAREARRARRRADA